MWARPVLWPDIICAHLLFAGQNRRGVTAGTVGVSGSSTSLQVAPGVCIALFFHALRVEGGASLVLPFGLRLSLGVVEGGTSLPLPFGFRLSLGVVEGASVLLPFGLRLSLGVVEGGTSLPLPFGLRLSLSVVEGGASLPLPLPLPLGLLCGLSLVLGGTPGG